MLAEQKIASPPSDEDASKPQCSPIGRRCPKPRAECARRYDTERVQFSLRSEKCSGRNNDLARHRENRAFHRHEQNDSQIAPLLDPLKPYLNQMMHIVTPNPSTTLRASSAEKSSDLKSNEFALVQSKN